MSAPPIILNQATSRATRALEAPHPQDVKVDGRTLHQLLSFAARFGPLVQFWDLSNRPDGNWQAFFASDEAAAHAWHGALDMHLVEARLRQLLQECRHASHHEHRNERLNRLRQALLQLVAVLDRTIHDSSDCQQRWDQLLNRPRQDALHRPLQRLLAHGVRPYHGSHPSHSSKLDDQVWHESLCSLLADFIDVLVETLRHGAQHARDAAQASTQRRGHAPQAALYNAFAMLFAQSRQELNRFPERLLDFYHEQVLRQRHVDEQPDHVFLTFTLNNDAKSADIDLGTLFTAGNDAQGQAIQYAADSALEVGVAAVTGLRVHRVSTPDPATNRPAAVLSGVVATPIDEKGAFPLFGCDKVGPFGALTMEPATLGFVVASPTLMLAGGERHVRILLKPTLALAGDPTEMVTAAGQAFSLYYSSAGAWVAVQDASFAPVNDGSRSFELVFDLPSDAPPLVALSTPSSGSPSIASTVTTLPASAFPEPDGQPAIVAQLRPQAMTQADSQRLYDLLSLLELNTVTLEVSVSQLPASAMRSPDGALSSQQTMAILGLKPAQHSTLDIQAPELFVKTISDLSLSITWVGLPINSTGFPGYYQGYKLNADGVPVEQLFDNSCFQVAFSVEAPGLWNVGDQAISLFQTSAGTCTPSGPVLQTSVLTVPGVCAAIAPPYQDPAASMLRMTLVNPSYAFGQTLYTINLTAASSANVAALRAGAPATGDSTSAGASAQLARAAAVNTTASDHSHGKEVRASLQQAAASLNGHALAALQQAIRQNVSDPDAQVAHAQDLSRAMGAGGGKGKGWLPWRKSPDAIDVSARIKAWAEAHESELASDALNQAISLLGSATSLGSAADTARQCTTTVARSILDAALRQSQQTVAQVNVQQAQVNTAGERCPLPNAPWLPQSSAVTISYTAQATVALRPMDDGFLSTQGDFLHLCPFRELKRPGRLVDGVPMLPEVQGEAALYIDLSAPADAVNLLFTLKTDLEIWSNEKPHLAWEQDMGNDKWVPLQLLADSTHGLLNSGIVSLRLRDASGSPPRLRVRLCSPLTNMPSVQTVSSNALSATWVGPGGRDKLGQPLPAGSITQSVNPIAGLGSIDQPMVSLGGRGRLTGPDFAMWMAERLRHKGYASTAWDWARLCLAAIPTLWQVAVVPATDARTGKPAPGKVWVVAVAGPGTPDVVDPTTPMVDASVLGEMHELLSQLVSPFVDVQVSNPPYARLTVTADLIFRDTSTTDHWLAMLQTELIQWLSPWPDASLGPRPADYYTREAVAEFIRQRDYVKGIKSIDLKHDGEHGNVLYLTSATKHFLRGKQEHSA